MAKFDFLTYMKQVAENLIELQHSENDRHFHRIESLGGLEELLQNLNFISGYQMLVIDRSSISLDDTSRSDNLIDRAFYTFFILKHAGLNNFDEIEQVKKGCRTTAEKILSKMFYDKRLSRNGLLNLDRSSVFYDTHGPIGNNFFGIMCTFAVADASDIAFNQNDWIS
jgi:hypothetical protein